MNADSAPSDRPSHAAYSGASGPAQSFLKMMIIAVTVPPIRPIHSHDSAAAGSTSISFHGHRPATTTSASRIAVLLTVPAIVIASSRTPEVGAGASACAAKPPNDFDFRTGFDVLSMGGKSTPGRKRRQPFRA